MSKGATSLLFSASLESSVKDITKFVKVNGAEQHQYEKAGFGGSADIFRGKYTIEHDNTIDIAVKRIRVKREEEIEKLTKKLAGELDIWRTVSEGVNIIKLLGTITGMGPLPSPVCELCPWNLQDYLDRKNPPPKHIKMMADTISGLSYMHEFGSGPIAHGDIKLSNILVTANETAMICDFGRSKQQHDQPRELSNSSPFAGTVRYMSPELFVPNVVGPTPAADMWAYGCVALEILCRVRPYDELVGELQVAERIRNGHPPSNRPRGLRASLINDALWSALSSCWQTQDWRPTSRAFLDRLTQMLNNGEIPTSPVLPNLFPRIGSPSELMELWPDELVDFRDQLEIDWGIGTLSSSVCAEVWLAALEMEGGDGGWVSTVAVKVPRLNVNTQNRRPHDQLQNIIRKMVQNRYGVRHRNIIDLLGIDSSFTPHPGLVLEYCLEDNLVTYCKANRIDRDEYTRPVAPRANAYSLMLDLLEGLKYMHDYPVPIPQGDLTPENILVTNNGVAKISLFSFGRALAALPPVVALTTSIGTLLPFRWMSPELLTTDQLPTTESDMWAVGCVCYWVLTGLKPYATHFRDDFAGVESVRGQPPGTLANVYYGSSWITNGIWGKVGRCWKYNPLLRPTATDFLRALKELEGRKLKWLPVNVMDLEGKIRPVEPGQPQPKSIIAQYITMWSSFNWVEQKRLGDVTVTMALYKTSYTPKWYSRAVPVVIKRAAGGASNTQALLASISYEIMISAQLNHPNICKLLGVDSDANHGPTMVFEFCSHTTLSMFLAQPDRDFGQCIQILADVVSAIVYIHEHANGVIAHGDIQPANIFLLSDGRAKLSNFTCAFQYVVGQPTDRNSLSAVVSTPQLPSLYCDPEYYKEKDINYLPLPTTAGDVWSFGSILLSAFSDSFREKNLDDHVAQITAGINPCHLEECSQVDDRILPLIRSILLLEPSYRPSARDILNIISGFL